MISGLDPKYFSYVRTLEWDEVFDTWRKNEEHQKRWQDLYTQHGYASWEEWRGQHIKPLSLDARQWHLYHISDPLKTVPTFYGGPFASWRRKYYGDRDTLTFAQLAALPAIQTNTVISELLHDFPSPTSLIGVVQSGRIVISEGMHRCCAIARAEREGVEFDATVEIALTDFGTDPLPELDSTRRA